MADDSPLSARGTLVVGPADFHPERVKLVIPMMPPFSIGDVPSDVFGVVGYGSGNYEVLVDALPTRVTARHLSREIATLPSGATRVRVAAFNLHNLSLDEPGRIVEVGLLSCRSWERRKFSASRRSSTTAARTTTVSTTLTLRALVEAIRTADGPAYDFREVLPVDGADGGAPGNNIRQALLFDPARVEFVDRGDSFGTAETRVVSKNGHPQLTRSPGRIEPADPAWVASRKPLACELRVDGSTLFVIVCHFVSKSRSSAMFGSMQPPVDPDANKRRRQAALVGSFASDALAIDPNARIVVLGDLNDDWFSASLAALEQLRCTAVGLGTGGGSLLSPL